MQRHGIKSLQSVLLVATCAMTLAWTSDTMAIFIRHDVPVAHYSALATRAEFQAAGYLGIPGSGGSSCSGTLVAPDKFLTAAHCIDGDFNGVPDRAANMLVVGFDVNFPAGGLPAHNVSDQFIHPNWGLLGGAPAIVFDVAVLELAAPIVGITPATISLADPLGQLGTMIGYGAQGDGLGNALIGANSRLGAQNILDERSLPLIITDFDNPNGTTNTFGDAFPVALEGSACFGDSGGPLYVGGFLVGDVIGGGVNCGYGNFVVWAPLRHPTNVAFLESLDLNMQIIPEPSTWLLLGTGLLGVLGYAWRKRKRHG